jgi:hypothetical protein
MGCPRRVPGFSPNDVSPFRVPVSCAVWVARAACRVFRRMTFRHSACRCRAPHGLPAPRAGFFAAWCFAIPRAGVVRRMVARAACRVLRGMTFAIRAACESAT